MLLISIQLCFTGCANIIFRIPGSEETVTDAPTANEEPPTEKQFWKDAAGYLDYYCEVALNSEFGDADRKVHKWEEQIQFYLFPSEDSEKYETYIKEHIDRLNEVEGFPGIIFAGSQEEAELTLEFITAEEMKSLTGPGSEEAFGYATISWYNKDGRIFKGSVYIVREADSGEEDVKHTIVEELTQAMGLMNDSDRYPDSIFYQGYSTVHELSEADNILLKLHYSPYITPGMNETQVRETVSRLAS